MTKFISTNNQIYGFTLLCLTSIVMVINYNTSNIVNYTVYDVKEFHLNNDGGVEKEPELKGWPPTISRDLKLYLEPTFVIKPTLPNNETIKWRGKDYPKMYILIIVHSSVNGYARRQAIRKTWAKDQAILPAHVIFLLGKTYNDEVPVPPMNHSLEEEIATFNDILQASFQDTYANLTLKSMFMLKYGTELKSSQNQYVMKVDDDSYINVNRLLTYAEIFEKRCQQNCILGHVLGPNSPVIRSKHHDRHYTKGWEVPWYIYNQTTFPNAVSGSGYMISRSSIPCLYNAGLETSFLNLEDIFITGLAASACHVKLFNSQWFNFLGKSVKSVRKTDILIHNVKNSEDMALIYKRLHS